LSFDFFLSWPLGRALISAGGIGCVSVAGVLHVLHVFGLRLWQIVGGGGKIIRVYSDQRVYSGLFKGGEGAGAREQNDFY
jgi:hypothetical protein